MTTPPPDAGLGFGEFLIALGTLFMNLCGALVGGTWALSRSREKVNQKIDQVALELERKINTETDTAMTRFGETISALKQKQNDDQFWNRDNFVSKATFATVMQDVRESGRRLEDKIDKLHQTVLTVMTDRLHPPGK